jgi:hypothetical protein
MTATQACTGLTPTQTPPISPPYPQRTFPHPTRGAAPGPVYRGGKINRGWYGRLWTDTVAVDNWPELILGRPVLSVLTRRLDSGGRRLAVGARGQSVGVQAVER